MVAYDILRFLLNIAEGLLGGACLLRLYMQYQRIPFGNPVGRFLFALTNWLVLPLRKVLPPIGRVDTSSLVAAYLVVLLKLGLLWLLFARGAGGAEMLPLFALIGLVRLAVSALIGLMIIYAILSWVPNESPVSDVIDRLAAPLLRPIRKVVPLVGGVDLSPMVFIVALYVVQMLLDYFFR